MSDRPMDDRQPAFRATTGGGPDGLETPPVFKKWRGWYWLVVAIAAVQFLVYFFITQSFS